jgi:hypothetical protein
LGSIEAEDLKINKSINIKKESIKILSKQDEKSKVIEKNDVVIGKKYLGNSSNVSISKRLIKPLSPTSPSSTKIKGKLLA